MTTRDFALADILTVTTGLLLSHDGMGGLYEIANHLTGDNLMTHQLPRAADVCGPALLRQHPQLTGVTPPSNLDTPHLLAWIADAEHRYGTTLPVDQLPAGEWERRDAVEELCDMVGPERVYVVPTTED